MGKGSIVSGGTDGSYSLKLDTGKATQTARLAKIDARLAELLTLITRAQGFLSVQQVFEAMAEAAVAPAIEAFVAASRADPINAAALKTALDAYTAAMVKLNEQRRKTAPLRLDLQRLQAEQIQLSKDRAVWAALVLEVTQQAWCADLTETATGAVATIEIPGEDNLVLIAPDAPAPTAADGVLTAREVQSPEQVFWNAAVLPGWQKWMPTYRRGTITAINAATDTVDVTLTEDRSSAQKLGINKVMALTAVPVVYMTCNSAAFEIGDKCVVKFVDHDWAQPKVVGFVDHPKACSGMLSGVIRDGTLVMDASTPPRPTLHSYKPTQQAWEYQLKSDPTKTPDIYHDERLLVPNSGQINVVSPGLFSGRMAKAVAVIMGRAKPVLYKWHWSQCHGLVIAADGLAWLIEISASAGVMAMRLPLEKPRPGGATSPQDVERVCYELFGGVPNGLSFPAGAALPAARASGTVIELASPAALEDFYNNKQGFSSSCGWSFNAAGSQAHNTCYATDSEGDVISYHYKLDISIGALINPIVPGEPIATGVAALSLVESGRLWWWGDNGTARAVPWAFYDPEVGRLRSMPGKILATEDATHIAATVLSTPVFVCYINDVLEVVRIVTNASSTTGTPGATLYGNFTAPGETVNIAGAERYIKTTSYQPDCLVYTTQYQEISRTSAGVPMGPGYPLDSSDPPVYGVALDYVESISTSIAVYPTSGLVPEGLRDGLVLFKPGSSQMVEHHLEYIGYFAFPAASNQIHWAPITTRNLPLHLLMQNYMYWMTEPVDDQVWYTDFVETYQQNSVSILPPAGAAEDYPYPGTRPDAVAAIQLNWLSFATWSAKPFRVTCSMLGPNRQLIYNTDEGSDLTAQGSMLADEPIPPTAAYTFIGYI